MWLSSYSELSGGSEEAAAALGSNSHFGVFLPSPGQMTFNTIRSLITGMPHDYLMSSCSLRSHKTLLLDFLFSKSTRHKGKPSLTIAFRGRYWFIQWETRGELHLTKWCGNANGHAYQMKRPSFHSFLKCLAPGLSHLLIQSCSFWHSVLDSIKLAFSTVDLFLEGIICYSSLPTM